MSEITDGTRLRYVGRAWSPSTQAYTHFLGGETVVALDGVDTTERGTCLSVTTEKLYVAAQAEDSTDPADFFLICDDDLEKVVVIEDQVLRDESEDDPQSIWERVQAAQDESAEFDGAGENKSPRTALLDVVKDYGGGEITAEALIANLLWFLADSEAETEDDDLVPVIQDACDIADKLGIKWTSGR